MDLFIWIDEICSGIRVEIKFGIGVRLVWIKLYVLGFLLEIIIL